MPLMNAASLSMGYLANVATGFDSKSIYHGDSVLQLGELTPIAMQQHVAGMSHMPCHWIVNQVLWTSSVQVH